jgi:hypothetical protein
MVVPGLAVWFDRSIVTGDTAGEPPATVSIFAARLPPGQFFTIPVPGVGLGISKERIEDRARWDGVLMGPARGAIASVTTYVTPPLLPAAECHRCSSVAPLKEVEATGTMIWL